MAVDAAQVHGEAFDRTPELFGPKVAALIDQGLSTSNMEYATALRHQYDFLRDFQQAMRAGPLVMPATPATAPGLETTGDAKFNSPWSYNGLPAATIPCGLDDSGLPVGLQIVSPSGSVEALLKVAAWCESQLFPDGASRFTPPPQYRN